MKALVLILSLYVFLLYSYFAITYAQNKYDEIPKRDYVTEWYYAKELTATDTLKSYKKRWYKKWYVEYDDQGRETFRSLSRRDWEMTNPVIETRWSNEEEVRRLDKRAEEILHVDSQSPN